MEYKGKLYGKIGNKYFDTGKTSDDYDALEKLINRHNKALIIGGVSKTFDCDAEAHYGKEAKCKNLCAYCLNRLESQ